MTPATRSTPWRRAAAAAATTLIASLIVGPMALAGPSSAAEPPAPVALDHEDGEATTTDDANGIQAVRVVRCQVGSSGGRALTGEVRVVMNLNPDNGRATVRVDSYRMGEVDQGGTWYGLGRHKANIDTVIGSSTATSPDAMRQDARWHDLGMTNTGTPVDGKVGIWFTFDRPLADPRCGVTADIPVAPSGLTAVTNAEVVLDRAESTPVPLVMRAQGDYPVRQLSDTSVLFRAPAGTHFAPGVTTLTGQKSVDGKNWVNDFYHGLQDVRYSGDDRVMVGSWDRGLELQPGEFHRWSPALVADSVDADVAGVVEYLVSGKADHNVHLSVSGRAPVRTPSSTNALRPVAQAPVELDRTAATTVPIVTEVTAPLNGVKDSVVSMVAPPGTAFVPLREIPGEKSTTAVPLWTNDPYASLQNVRYSDDDTRLDVTWNRGFVARPGDTLRWLAQLKVTPAAGDDALSGDVSYSAKGTNATGPAHTWDLTATTPVTATAHVRDDALTPVAQAPVELDRTAATTVPVVVHAFDRFSIMEGVSFSMTAPEGTAFVRLPNIPSQTSPDGTTWFDASLGALEGVRYSDDRTRLTFTGDLWQFVFPGLSVRWLPQLEVQGSAGDAALDGELAYEFSGSAGLGVPARWDIEAGVPVTARERGQADALTHVAQPAVELDRTTERPVPVVVEATVDLTGLKDSTVSMVAPTGTTFVAAETIPAERSKDEVHWTAEPQGALRDPVLSDDGTRLTVDWTGDLSLSSGDKVRWMPRLTVLPSATAEAITGQVTYTARGTTSSGPAHVWNIVDAGVPITVPHVDAPRGTIVEIERYERGGLEARTGDPGFWCHGDSFPVGYRAWKEDDDHYRKISTVCSRFGVEGHPELKVLRGLDVTRTPLLDGKESAASCAGAVTQYLFQHAKDGDYHQAACAQLDVVGPERQPVRVDLAPGRTTSRIFDFDGRAEAMLGELTCPAGQVLGGVTSDVNHLIGERSLTCRTMGTVALK